MIRKKIIHLAHQTSTVIRAVLLAASLLAVFGETTGAMAARDGIQASEVGLETPTGTLSGTLLLPSGKAPFPVVLIIAGSGLTDRDGNSVGMGKSDALRLLAEAVGAKPVLITGMNHELKTAPLDRAANDAASEDPKRPLADGLLEQLVSFLTRALG